MNLANKIAIGISASLALLLLLLLGSLLLVTEGSMPSKNDAIRIQPDVITYAANSSKPIPTSVKELNPLSITVLPSGVLIVFKRIFVEDYGYFYKLEDRALPTEFSEFLSESSPGLYRYYYPG